MRLAPQGISNSQADLTLVQWLPERKIRVDHSAFHGPSAELPLSTTAPLGSKWVQGATPDTSSTRPVFGYHEPRTPEANGAGSGAQVLQNLELSRLWDGHRKLVRDVENGMSFAVSM